MPHGEVGAGERLGAALAHDLGCREQLHRLERVGHLGRLRLRRLARFLRMDGLEHLGDPRPLLPRHLAEHVAAEADGAPPVSRLGENLLERPEHPQRLIAGDEPHARQPAPAQPQQELLPGFPGLGEPLGAAHDLAAALRVHADGDHHRDVLVGPAPASLQVYAVDERVRVAAGKRPGPPGIHAFERLLVEVRHGSGRDARAPQDLGDVLDAARGNARQVHLYDCLLDARLPSAVALYDGGLEGGAAKLGGVEHDLAARGDQLPLVMAGPVRLAGGRPLVALRPDHLVGFLVQQGVEHLLHGFPHELAKV